MAYLLQGILFVGLIFVAVYAMDSRKGQNNSDIIVPTSSSMTTAFSLASPAFEQNGRIPSKFTCDGDRSINPPLKFSGVPEEAKSLALIMDDPDVPKVLHPDGVFDHWVLFNIPPPPNPPTGGGGTLEIAEGKSVGIAGVNGRGDRAYTGPCPPPQYEPSEHRYIFVLYALDSTLALNAGATKQEVLKAMEGHILAQARLVGRYSRE